MSSPDISFEHFDPSYELGSVGQNGEAVRPRKKPGRKPNPPSPAQRKAQNRAAQRAFRERKRREMQEAELNVKRSMYQRDQAVQEANVLRQKNQELLYENNYLKGFVLTLKLACLANRVDVPKFWDAGKTDAYGAERLTFSRTKGIPQSLEFFLDRQHRIISFSDSASKDDKDLLAKVSSSPPSSIQDLYSTLLGNTNSNVGLDVATIAPQLANHLESPFFQQLLNTDLVSSRASSNDLTSLLNSTPSSFTSESTPEDTTDMDLSIYINDPMDSLLENGTAENVLLKEEKEKSSCDVEENVEEATKLPFMVTAEAIHRLRSLQHIGKDCTSPFTPTELQRTIPHDTRIDIIPGAAMRDHMILFQDFYDADDLFTTLIENAVFTGPELGNPDCWLVPKRFLAKYWFLLPNHSPQKRTDDAVETAVNFGQKMLQMLMDRKQMYIDREDHPSCFPRQYEDSASSTTSSTPPSLETMNVFMTANNDIFAAS
ncbi:hypothetical protein BJV82DRAFT_582043 [Fennellomyces sp. T-0311]|nr:hypothetical protein BJV82DRAFT_582043 [Fennellomyces sp. T-0311]